MTHESWRITSEDKDDTNKFRFDLVQFEVKVKTGRKITILRYWQAEVFGKSQLLHSIWILSNLKLERTKESLSFCSLVKMSPDFGMVHWAFRILNATTDIPSYFTWISITVAKEKKKKKKCTAFVIESSESRQISLFRMEKIKWNKFHFDEMTNINKYFFFVILFTVHNSPTIFALFSIRKMVSAQEMADSWSMLMVL